MSVQTIDIAGLYIAEQGRLKRLVRRLVENRSTADDLVQQAFEKLLRTVEYGNPENCPAYLTSTVRNLALNHIYGVEGKVRNRGLELNIFGELTDELRLLGGATFMDGVQTKTLNGLTDGKKAIGIPDTQINLGAEWDTPFITGLTLTGRAIYTDSQYASIDNTQSIPDWTRFDLGARYTFNWQNGKPLTIRASIENVFDKSYWAAASTNFGLARGAPRTFLVSTTLDF